MKIDISRPSQLLADFCLPQSLVNSSQGGRGTFRSPMASMSRW